MLKVAIYISSHGFGHASRMAALADELIALGISVFLRSDSPDFLFQNLQSPFMSKADVVYDFGVVHKAGLQTDLEATKNSLLTLFSHRQEIVEKEVMWLRKEKIDFAIVDIPFLAIEACDYALVPVYAISNFDWFFIYSQIFAADKELRPLINTIFGLYARVKAAFRLPFSSLKSMAAFPKATKLGLLAKRKELYADIRDLYQIDSQDRILACTFGGEKGLNVDMQKICKAYKGAVISSNEDVDAPNHRYADKAADWLDLIHGCDALLTKPGYSTFAEACQFGKPILYIARQNYPEEKVLIKGLASYKAAIEVPQKLSSISSWKTLFSKLPANYQAPASYKNQNTIVAAAIISTHFKLTTANEQLKSVFDLGSNNLNYLLFNSSEAKVLHTAHYDTELSKGLDKQDFSLFKAIMTKLMHFDGKIPSVKCAISTAVAREHQDFSQVSSWLLKRFELKVKTLKQPQEADAAFAAVKASLPLLKEPLVIDIGGLSTELAWGHSYKQRKSVSLGLLSLEYTSYDSLHLSLYQALPEIHDLHKYSLVVTGLTGTYIASAIYGLSYQLAWQSHAKTVNHTQIQSMLAELKNENSELSERLKKQGMKLFILKAALLFVRTIMEKYQMTQCSICYYGISLGHILK